MCLVLCLRFCGEQHFPHPEKEVFLLLARVWFFTPSAPLLVYCTAWVPINQPRAALRPATDSGRSPRSLPFPECSAPPRVPSGPPCCWSERQGERQPEREAGGRGGPSDPSSSYRSAREYPARRGLKRDPGPRGARCWGRIGVRGWAGAARPLRRRPWAASTAEALPRFCSWYMFSSPGKASIVVPGAEGARPGPPSLNRQERGLLCPALTTPWLERARWRAVYFSPFSPPFFGGEGRGKELLGLTMVILGSQVDTYFSFQGCLILMQYNLGSALLRMPVGCVCLCACVSGSGQRQGMGVGGAGRQGWSKLMKEGGLNMVHIHRSSAFIRN